MWRTVGGLTYCNADGELAISALPEALCGMAFKPVKPVSPVHTPLLLHLDVCTAVLMKSPHSVCPCRRPAAEAQAGLVVGPAYLAWQSTTALHPLL